MVQVGKLLWPNKAQTGGRNGARREKETKKLFEANDDDSEDMVQQREKLKSKDAEQEDDYSDVDGTWWWQDAAPMNYAKVKLETREANEETGRSEKVRHEVLSDWGNLDGYAFNFRRGKIIKADPTLPVGSKTVGFFSIKVSPHRPLVSKDFMAFQ